jgi:hypothetical protein
MTVYTRSSPSWEGVDTSARHKRVFEGVGAD